MKTVIVSNTREHAPTPLQKLTQVNSYIDIKCGRHNVGIINPPPLMQRHYKVNDLASYVYIKTLINSHTHTHTNIYSNTDHFHHFPNLSKWWLTFTY